MKQVLTSTQATGDAFYGTGGRMLFLVQQGSTARNIVPQFKVPGSANTWVSLTAFTDPDAAGHQVIEDSSREVEYRLNPAAAGPNVWLLDTTYAQRNSR